MLSSIYRRLRKAHASRPLMQQLIDLMRQWPWVYPRGVERSAKQWIEKEQVRLGWYSGLRGDWYEEIYPGGINVHALPDSSVGPSGASFTQVASQRYPEASVSHFKDAHVFSDEGQVLTRDNRLQAQYFHHFGTRRVSTSILARPFGHLRLRVQRIPEPVGLLAAPQGRNYYHWIFDVLPRVHLLSRWAGVIEKYVVPEHLISSQLESLRHLGIAESQL